ncbi:N-carbamoyl-L-amino-acid hydrolase [Abditibacteriota bacterium]|nr:N-carbamoyl-L-amino-acid hydrolase [Abditibacteriota bacterium]
MQCKMDVLNRHPSWRQSANRVLERCEQLAQCSDSRIGLTRTFLSPAMDEAHEMVVGWMREAALTPHVDEMGNLIGHYPANETNANGKKWLFGSHLDTVPNAGKYDGALGVLLAIEVISQLQGQPLPFAIEVIGFSEEEGVRFRTPYLGSRAIAGTFDPNLLSLLDHNGVSMAQALRHFGLAPEGWEHARYQSDSILGYLEAHIEQGPLLETLDAPLGIVTDIVGQSRLQVRFKGQSGHAGTQPMNLRRDALTAASEWVLAVESLGGATEGLVATVGSLDVGPNTPNVVAGETVCSLDVRHPNDSARESAVEKLLATASDIATRRNINFEILARSSQKAVPMDTQLREQLQAACDGLSVNAPEMVSGAGHDAAIMAMLCPCAMLFLRTPGGASHCPEEAVDLDDVALALEAMHSFLLSLSPETGELIESPTF